MESHICRDLNQTRLTNIDKPLRQRIQEIVQEAEHIRSNNSN